MTNITHLQRRRHRALIILAADWALTKKRMAQRCLFARNYVYLRRRGLSRAVAWHSAGFTFT